MHILAIMPAPAPANILGHTACCCCWGGEDEGEGDDEHGGSSSSACCEAFCLCSDMNNVRIGLLYNNDDGWVGLGQSLIPPLQSQPQLKKLPDDPCKGQGPQTTKHTSDVLYMTDYIITTC
jgi:hypothetical protein